MANNQLKCSTFYEEIVIWASDDEQIWEKNPGIRAMGVQNVPLEYYNVF